MKKSDRINFRLMLVAEGLAFGCITILQIIEFPLFLVFLLLMHVGIALFIVSKKRFLKNGRDVFSFYRTEYLMLAVYLPILAYKLLSYVLLYEVVVPVKIAITLGLTAVNVVLTVINMMKLHKQLKTEKE